jgi:topoisomerase-4 subunit A
VLVDNRETIAHAYATGRGSFRLRREDRGREGEGRGLAPAGPRNPIWRAEGQADRGRSPSSSPTRKLPILADVRDESAGEVRIVLEPRSRTVDPELLLESLTS